MPFVSEICLWADIVYRKYITLEKSRNSFVLIKMIKR